MSRGIGVPDEIDVIVERKGYGAHVWRWRLSNGEVNLARSDGAFRSAEEAYQVGKANLRALQANDARLGRRRMELAFTEQVDSFAFVIEAH